MPKKIVRAADLFCGAGGTSTGFIRAMKKLGLEFELVAVNHWDVAIATHNLNHPGVRHINSDLERVDPRIAVPGGFLDLLMASPECTYYSNALGGKPINNQSRATPKWVLKWASNLDIKKIIIENVPEFRGWGPVHRTCNCGTGTHVDAKEHQKKCHFQKPIQSRKGQYFKNFIRKLRDLGYTVDYRVLCAADYGAPTERKRLFIICEKGVRHITWPEPTHHEKGGDLRGKKKHWKTARSHVLDLSLPGKSIFTGKWKKPISKNTLKRIAEGMRRFNGLDFVLSNQSWAKPWELDRPLPTITASGSVALYQPFLINLDQGGSVRDVERPMHTLTSAEATGVVEPFLVSLRGTSEEALDNTARSLDRPAPTITGGGNHLGLVEPFIIPHYNERDGQKPRTHSVDEPFPTVVNHGRHALVQPFLIRRMGDPESHVHSVDDPTPAITGENNISYVQPFLIQQEQTGSNGTRLHEIDRPMKTITGSAAHGLVQPFIVEYYGTGGAQSIDEPMPTVTGNDRFGLAMPVIKTADGKTYLLDIRYRMLTTKEYARAQDFPEDYRFTGTKKEIQKQIGNAVPPAFAEALTYHKLKEYAYA